MKLLTLIIPEPWLSLGIIAALFAAWFYGDLSGSSREAQKAEIASLTSTVAALEQQRDAAVAIQTQMAQRLSEVRAESLQRKKVTDDLVQQLRAKPAAAGCILDDARRLRLQAIRIGHPRADSGAR